MRGETVFSAIPYVYRKKLADSCPLVPFDPGHYDSAAVDHFLRVLGSGRQVSVMPSLAALNAIGLRAVHKFHAVAVRTGSRPLSPGDSLLGSGVS